MTNDELHAIEVRAATSQHGITQAEAMALVAEVRRCWAERQLLLGRVAEYAQRFPQFVPVEAIVGYCAAMMEET